MTGAGAAPPPLTDRSEAEDPDARAARGGEARNLTLFVKGGAVSFSLAISAIAYLVAYAILAREAGLAAIGLWGIIASFFQYGRVIDFGASASVLNKVGALLARDDRAGAAEHLDQACNLSTLTAIVASLAITAALYLYARVSLSPTQATTLHIDIVLAINAVALILMSQGSVLHAGIDAHNRAELRALIVLVGSVIFAVLAIALAPRLSILGIAIAQLAQWLVMGVVSRVLLMRLDPALRFLPRRPRLAAMRGIVAYGFPFQVSALIAAALDPLAKAMAVGFGGLGFAGQFEILMRIVGGGRTIFANGFQVLAPATSRLSGEALKSVLANSFVLGVRIALLFLIVFLTWTPLIARAVSATAVHDYRLTVLFVVAWAVNLLAGPAYFTAIGQSLGRLNLNSHLCILVVLLAGGAVGGPLAGGIGVVVAYAAAIVIGSLWLALAVNARFAIGAHALSGAFGPAAIVAIGCALAASLYSAGLPDSLENAALAVAICVVAVIATFGRYFALGRAALARRRRPAEPN